MAAGLFSVRADGTPIFPGVKLFLPALIVALASTTAVAQSTGLKGEYFDNPDFTALKVTRIDPQVNFTWLDAPAPGVQGDTFSVRWTGWIKAPTTEAYTFSVTSDDGCRLWVNDQLLLESWTEQAVAETTASKKLSLTAGQWYPVKVEFYDNTQTAIAKLAWASPTRAKAVVASQWLSPTYPGSIYVPTGGGQCLCSCACPVTTGTGGTGGGTGAGGSGGSGGSTNADGGVVVKPDTGVLVKLDAGARLDAGLVVVPPPPSGMQIGTQLWQTDWLDANQTFAPNVDFTTTSNPFSPTLVREIAKFTGPFRAMDASATNGSSQRIWSDRTMPTDPVKKQQSMWAWEWVATMCNVTGRDCWINVPALADADYVFQLATLMKAKLRAGLKLYIEWSNETWNGAFSQTQYSFAQGNALGLRTDPWSAAFVYHVYSAVRAFEQFERVYGKNNPILVKVIAGQTGNEWLIEQHLNALKDAKINPNGVTVDAYATAPYFGHDLTGASSVEEVMAAMRASCAEVKMDAATVAKYPGVAFVAYEGGIHIYKAGADVFSRRTEIYLIYMTYLEAVSQYFKVFVHYNHVSTYASGGAWGAEERVGQPIAEAHKMRAIIDWMAAHR